MHLLLEEKLRIGIQTIHRIGEPTAKHWHPGIDELVA